MGEGYKNDEITSNVLKNVEKNVGEGFSTWQKNVGEGWSEINPFTPRDTIKNGIALIYSYLHIYNHLKVISERYLQLFTHLQSFNTHF